MRYYCTYFDRHYLTRGLALLTSLRRHESSPYTLFVVCMDEITRAVLARLAIPGVRLIPLHEIERRDEALLAAKCSRSLVEYYWTMTPTIILRILERHREVDLLTYLDADLFFFSSPQPIFEELGRNSILIHEHRFSSCQAHLGAHNGRFNVGLLSFRRDARGLQALRWWRARCLEWCFAKYEQGKMGDQLYLEDWPTRFEGVTVLRHPGGGVGPWNHDQYRIDQDDNHLPWVNDVPAIFYHFHAFAQVDADVALPVKHPHYPLPWAALKLFFIPYLRTVDAMAQQVLAVFPQSIWHLSPEQPVTARHTVLVRRSRVEAMGTAWPSHERIMLDDEWECMCSNQVIGRPEPSDSPEPKPSRQMVATSIKRDSGVRPSDGSISNNWRVRMDQEMDNGNPSGLCTSLARLVQACSSLAATLAQSSSNPASLEHVLAHWVKAHGEDPLLAPLIDQLQRKDPRLLAFLPQRLQLALGYVTRPLQDLITWLGASNETTNLTYDLTQANSLHLAWTISLVTATPLSVIKGFLAELDQDATLKTHIEGKTVTSGRRLTSDTEARYGRRAGWYALVRALKPKVVVETGVDKGLGTCVLAAALLRNRAEGYEGRLYSTDIDPTAGFLFASPYDQVGQIIYGDSITTLKGMTEPIDIFIADSAHTAEYERGEYGTVHPVLAPQAVIVSDNAHVTQELAHFAEGTGRQFLYFREEPRAHFYPGAGMGIAYMPRVAPTVNTPPSAGPNKIDRHQLQSPVQPVLNASIGNLASGPLVSVLVSAYESEAFMQECLEDLVGQTIADQLEIIVVDAASPQNEGRIVKGFQERHHNIHYIRTPTRIGVYAAWNLALRLARGRYVTPFSTNDRLSPDAYERLVDTLDKKQDVALVYGDTYLTDLPHQTFARHHRIGVWHWPDYRYDELLRKCGVGPHPMWRREVHDDVGYFNEAYVALGDQEFWIRLGAHHRLLHIPVVTGLYWCSPEGLSNRAEIAGPEERRLRSIYVPSAKPGYPIPEVEAETKYDCSVIIPVWNRCELTRDCLTALAKTTEGLSWELIVVDNNSTDGTQEFLSTLDGDVRIIRNQENLGFAKACNQGAAAARGTYLVFLNNDTIPLKDWLRPLMSEVEEDPKVGIVGSKLLYQDGTVQHAGVVRDLEDRFPYHIYKNFPGDHRAVNQRREFQIVTAACMLIRRSLFEEVMGFDEDYVNGFEDADLCLKVRERGYTVVYQPRSVVIHLESQTPGRKAHEDANAARFLQRWSAQWWGADEDRHLYIDGYNLRRIVRNGQTGGDIMVGEEIKDGASWAHVAATQTAALMKDWESVRRELALSDEWPNDQFVLLWGAMVAGQLQESVCRAKFLSRYVLLVDAPSERVELIRILMGQKDLPGAEEHLCCLLSASPGHAEGLLLKGILHMQREQFGQAESAFGAALQEGADRKKCLMGMGMAALGRAYAQGAWERFLEVLVDNPDDADAIHWLLRAGTAQNRWADLMHQLSGYISRNPEDLAIRFALAGVLVRADQIKLARHEYEALRALAPTFDGLEELGEAIRRQETVLDMEVAHR